MAERIISNIKLPNGEVCKIGGSSGFELFDTTLKDHILTYEQTKGWALQGTYVYKEAVAGSRYGYPDFYAKCVEEFESGENSWLKSNVTKVGSLVDNQGVLSGFSSSNYAKIQNYFSPSSSTWEVVLKAKLSSIPASGTSSIMLAGLTDSYISLEIGSAGKIQFLIGNGSSWVVNTTVGTTVFQTNTDYWFKLGFNGTAYTVYSSTNGSDWTQEATATNSVPMSNVTLVIGISRLLNNSFLGAIDLKESYININGERWWNGTDTITKNPNGHLFYDISEKDKIDELYNTNGIAWYYGIDKENERIFLPRAKHFAFTGGVMGNGMTLGLTDGANNYGLVQSGGTTTRVDTAKDNYGSPVGSVLSGSSGAGSTSYGITTDPTKSGIALETDDSKYLYICVGNTNVESAVTDVVDVTTTENDTVPLFTGQYFDFKPNNVSWLKAGEQANSGGIYTFTYNELVNILNGETKYGDLKVINVADMEVGVDYSEYWKVNQDDMTFITPTAISNKALSGGVMGNGMALGLTNGTEKAGLIATGMNYNPLSSSNTVYGSQVGTTQTNAGTGAFGDKALGITTDPTKSGIIAEQSTSQLYFKVANAVQNLELLDAGEVMEAVNNVVPNNSSLISGYAMPSNKYIDLTLGASGTTYTAPANGYVNYKLHSKDSSNLSFALWRNHSSNDFYVSGSSDHTSAMYGLVLPVTKGELFGVSYSNTNFSTEFFRFYYAVGSESEV